MLVFQPRSLALTCFFRSVIGLLPAGASGNVAMVGLRTQLAIERAGLETPHLKRGAPDFYPSDRTCGMPFPNRSPMGGLRQKTMRWTTTGPPMSGALHPWRGHLRPPPALAGRWPGYLRMERDYAHGHQSQAMTLEAVEFIRRFLLHVLPSGLVRIRHFGFLANRKRKQKLALCRSWLPARPTTAEWDATSPTIVMREARSRSLSDARSARSVG
jgi:hypothetical protein